MEGDRQVELQIGHQRQVLPVWMTDQQHCAALTCGLEPHCSWEILLQLARLLQVSEPQASRSHSSALS
jgi:hypothetical protein